LKLAQQRLTIHYDIAAIMDENLTIVEAMPRFLETICTHLGWAFGEM